jgi:hypothetical protein
MRKLMVSLVLAGAQALALQGEAVAAPSYEYDIPVAQADDYSVETGRYWGWFGSGRWGPDTVAGGTLIYADDYHDYWPGSGQRSHHDGYVSIGLGALPSALDIVGAVLRFQVKEVYAPRSDNAFADIMIGSAGVPETFAATLSGLSVDQVVDVDVTDPLKQILALGDGSVRFRFTSCYECSGYNTVGFAFGAAEGGNGARLLIDTGDDGIAALATPLPGTLPLLLPALAALGFVGRPRREA